MEEIGMDITICSKKRCRRARGKVDTGANVTVIPLSVAEAAGLSMSNGGYATGVGNKKVNLRQAEATVCLPGRCACRKQKVYIAEDAAMHGEVLVGMDFLNGARAVVDAGNGDVRCRRRGTRRSAR